MKEMFFGDALSFDSILEAIGKLESQVNNAGAAAGA